MPTSASFDYDVLIVGGGPAGLSAALTLGRARRRVLVCDAGDARNAPAAHAHGLLTRDGTPPLELRRLGRAELDRYGVEVRDVRIAALERTTGGYCATTARGRSVTARTVILATGVVDELLPIPGVAEGWGVSVVHCPYCHGYELADRPTGVVGRGDGTYAQARLLRAWTDDLTVLTNGPEDLSPAQEASLSAYAIKVDRRAIERFDVDARGQVRSVVFEDGAETPLGAVYVRPPQSAGAPFAQDLGADCTPEGVKVDADGRTGVPGLFVVGDAAVLDVGDIHTVQNLAYALHSGVRAGMGVVFDLVAGGSIV